MNRAMPDMDEEELFQTGVSISESFLESKHSLKQSSFGYYQKHELSDKARQVMKDIATAYLKYINERLSIKNFHGLRDYYSLVKFISRGLLSDSTLMHGSEKDAVVFKGLQRNFGGLPADRNTLLNIFQIQANSDILEATNVLKLMEENINDPLARHLMCITSGDSAMGLVERLLTDMNRDEKVVIFGSQFEEDQTTDYSYRILSRIILCMEQGFVLILKDLENIYGSLYDMLNQNYTVIGKKKHYRVALGHYSNPICHVHDNFRCIVLVDESKLNYADPPFLNRFEKQYLRFSDTVTKQEEDLIVKLTDWTKQVSEIEDDNFDEFDCFPIYSLDMIPSLVLKVCRETGEARMEETLESCKRQLLFTIQSDAIFRLGKNKFVDMRKNAKRIKNYFLQLPIHSGIWSFIDYQLSSIENGVGVLTIVLTNSSIHSQDLYSNKHHNVQMEKLGAFKSEKQLYLRIQHFWSEAPEMFLFLHCSAAEDHRHISLAKATIDSVRAEAVRERKDVTKHVYLIIHLDRRRAETKAMLPINYLSGWEIVTLDSLAYPAIPLPELSTLCLTEVVQRKTPLAKYITEQLFWSFSRIRYEKQGRDLKSIQTVIEKIETSEEFLLLIEKHVLNWVGNEFRGSSTSEWVSDIALNPYFINSNSSFLVALEQEVLSVIKEPVAKLIYQMENMSVITCFFCEDGCEERTHSLERMLNEEYFFSISSVHNETGPECYTCNAVDLPLRMPFSKTIFDKAEELKEEFMDTYQKVREKCDIDEEEIMPEQLLEMLFSKQEKMFEQSLPDLSEYIYSSLCDDYIHDFCYFVSRATPSKLIPKRKHQIIKWCLEQEMNFKTKNIFELLVRLHATFWIFSSALLAEYALFETCSEIFNIDENFLQFMGCSSDDNKTDDLDESKIREDAFLNKAEAETVDSSDEAVYERTSVQTSSLENFRSPDNQHSRMECISSSEDDSQDTIQEKYHIDSGMTVNGKAETVTSPIAKDNLQLEGEYDQDSTRRAIDTSSTDTFEQIYYTPDSRQGTAPYVEDYNRDHDAEIPMVVKKQDEVDQHIEKEVHSRINSHNDRSKGDASDTDINHYNDTSDASLDYDSPRFEGVRSPLLETRVGTKELSLKTINDNYDPRRDLIEFVCRKMLPSQETLDMFGTVEEWKKRVSIVLTHAVKMSSDPMVLHSLRFCSDLISIVGKTLPDTKWKKIVLLGNMLKTEENSRLDSPGCFDCVCDLVFNEPPLSLRDARRVIGSYLNRCIASDPETEVVIQFLQLPLDKVFLDSEFDILKPPLQFALESTILSAEEEADDLFFSIIKNSDGEMVLADYPLLCALDTTLKSLEGTVAVDSQFAVLVVDILEEYFSQSIKDLEGCDADEVKTVFLSAESTIRSNNYGLKFLNAIAFYKSFIHHYADIIKQNNLDTPKFKAYLPVVSAVIGKENDSPTSLALTQYFIKEIGKGLFPWSLYTSCEKLTDSFDFLKSWEWTDNYMFQCVEGNPLLQCAPSQIKGLIDILDNNDVRMQATMFKKYLNENRDYTGQLAVLAVGISRFYIARKYRQQDDTYNRLADTFVQIAEEERMDTKNLHFFKCLLGVRFFAWLELHECSDELQTACSLFASSLFAIVLASNSQAADSRKKSLLSRLLLCPSEVETSVLTSVRSFCRRRHCEGSGESNQFCFTCNCGYRLFVKNGRGEKSIGCPLCFQETSRSVSVSKSVENKNLTFKMSAIKDIVEKIIGLCVNSCLLGSLILETSTEKNLEAVTGICEIDDIPKTLVEVVQNKFKDLQRHLSLNCRDTYIFLQACLLTLKGFLTDSDSVSREELVYEWIDGLILKVEPLIKDRYRTIIDAVEQQNRALHEQCEAPELSVNENDRKSICSDERKRIFPSLFRVQGTGNREMFEFELALMAERDRHPYPFLQLVMDVMPHLELTEHILTVVRWHMATVTQIEYRMKKRQCLEMTVEDFIHYDANEKVRKRLQDRFESLQKSLSVLKKAGQRFEVLSSRITGQTRMMECLILNNSSVLYTVIKELCDIQNAFLDSVLEISATRECNALEFLSKCDGISAIPISVVAELKVSAIVKYQWDDELMKLSQADLRYGYGSQIRYEYETIEKLLAVKLVAGKCYIALEKSLPSIKFVDEFYKGYSKMAKEIKNIIPQKTISSDIIQKIKEKRELHPRLTVELITHIGVLISLVKKTKGEEAMPLIEYVEKWKDVFTSPMPSKLLPTPENCIRLCHLIELYGLLEELNADSLIDSLGDEYRKPMSFDIQNQLNGLFEPNQKLAEMTLRATKRFVYRCLISGDVDSTQPLAEYLADDSFWPYDISSVMGGLTGTFGGECRNNPTDYLPRDLKVHSVAEMIFHLESKLKELSEKDVKLRELTTSFASRGPRTAKQKIRKLAQKRNV